MTDKERIEDACQHNGIAIDGWETTDDGETAQLGRWVVSSPDSEDEGLYEGDEGTLTAVVVGSEDYGNQRVSFGFTADGTDCPDCLEIVAYCKAIKGVPEPSS